MANAISWRLFHKSCLLGHSFYYHWLSKSFPNYCKDTKFAGDTQTNSSDGSRWKAIRILFIHCLIWLLLTQLTSSQYDIKLTSFPYSKVIRAKKILKKMDLRKHSSYWLFAMTHSISNIYEVVKPTILGNQKAQWNTKIYLENYQNMPFFQSEK